MSETPQSACQGRVGFTWHKSIGNWERGPSVGLKPGPIRSGAQELPLCFPASVYTREFSVLRDLGEGRHVARFSRQPRGEGFGRVKRKRKAPCELSRGACPSFLEDRTTSVYCASPAVTQTWKSHVPLGACCISTRSWALRHYKTTCTCSSWILLSLPRHLLWQSHRSKMDTKTPFGSEKT